MDSRMDDARRACCRQRKRTPRGRLQRIRRVHQTNSSGIQTSLHLRSNFMRWINKQTREELSDICQGDVVGEKIRFMLLDDEESSDDEFLPQRQGNGVNNGVATSTLSPLMMFGYRKGSM